MQRCPSADRHQLARSRPDDRYSLSPHKGDQDLSARVVRGELRPRDGVVVCALGMEIVR
jgi:hypothetical protein